MKNRTIQVIFLVLLAILGGVAEVYAGEARAYATVTIIIPPRQEAAQVMIAETEQKGTHEEDTSTDVRLASVQTTEETQDN